jgi:GGDEF domain-containing protein
VGLTIGYALAPMDGITADELIKRADAAMYAGKQAGRRRVQRGGRSMVAA